MKFTGYLAGDDRHYHVSGPQPEEGFRVLIWELDGF